MMPNHPPKTLSYKDAKFIEETLDHWIDYETKDADITQDDVIRSYDKWAALLDDTKRCIKILESEDE